MALYLSLSRHLLDLTTLTVPCLLRLLLRSIVKGDVWSDTGNCCWLAGQLARGNFTLGKSKSVEWRNPIAWLRPTRASPCSGVRFSGAHCNSSLITSLVEPKFAHTESSLIFRYILDVAVTLLKDASNSNSPTNLLRIRSPTAILEPII